MAGLTPPNRATRRAQAATKPAAPVVAAELGTTTAADPVAPIAADLPHPAPPGVAVIDADAHAEVLPDPSLVAEPGALQPLVTASPPLAAEASAEDVVKAAATVSDPTATADPLDAPPLAGQTMLAIERPAGEADRPLVDEFEHLAPFAAALDPAPAVTRRVTVIEVVGPPQGRRRAGFAFGPEPRRFLASALDEGQLEALRGDRQLTVGVSDVSLDDAALDALLAGIR